MIVVSLSGLTGTGVDLCDGTAQGTVDCGAMNTSFAFPANPNGGTVTFPVTIRGGCQYVRYAGTPSEQEIVEDPLVVYVDIVHSCSGLGVGVHTRVTQDLKGEFTPLTYVGVFDCAGAPSSVTLDPDDGCVNSASVGPCPMRMQTGILPINLNANEWGRFDFFCKNSASGRLSGDGKSYGGPMVMTVSVSR
jgi:hypothetical protein